jgi:hypothetical protein
MARRRRHPYMARSKPEVAMTRRWGVLAGGLAALVLVLAPWGAAQARPMEGVQQQQLLALYNRYNAAITAGKLEAALTLRSTAVRTALATQLKTAKDQQDYLAGAKEMEPDRLELRHASINDAGDKALLIVLADKTLTAGTAQSELDMGFVKEAGVWKLGDLVQGPGPADITRCRDPNAGPLTAYDTSRSVSLTGRIERVDFLPDHTVVMLLAGNTETCAFLPDRATLQQHGLDPAILQAYRIAVVTGAAERTNPQKVMVNNITVHAEE